MKVWRAQWGEQEGGVIRWQREPCRSWLPSEHALSSVCNGAPRLSGREAKIPDCAGSGLSGQRLAKDSGQGGLSKGACKRMFWQLIMDSRLERKHDQRQSWEWGGLTDSEKVFLSRKKRSSGGRKNTKMRDWIGVSNAELKISEVRELQVMFKVLGWWVHGSEVRVSPWTLQHSRTMLDRPWVSSRTLSDGGSDRKAFIAKIKTWT